MFDPVNSQQNNIQNQKKEVNRNNLQFKPILAAPGDCDRGVRGMTPFEEGESEGGGGHTPRGEQGLCPFAIDPHWIKVTCKNKQK